MNDNSSRLREVVTALLALATALLGLSSLKDRVGSFRPPAPASLIAPAGAGQDVVARMWEDPFAVVRAAPGTHNHNVDGHRPPWLQSSISNRWNEYHGQVRIMAVFMEGGLFTEETETRLRLRLAVLHALLGAA